MPFQPDLAERETRLGAAILDHVIFGAMVCAPILVATFITWHDPNALMVLVLGLLLTLAGFVSWCWLTILYVERNGQSIAKKILGIKVVRVDGSAISLGRLFWLRNVLNQLLCFVPLYGIIEVLFVFGDSRQCLHDRIADTIVVNA